MDAGNAYAARNGLCAAALVAGSIAVGVGGMVADGVAGDAGLHPLTKSIVNKKINLFFIDVPISLTSWHLVRTFYGQITSWKSAITR